MEFWVTQIFAVCIHPPAHKKAHVLTDCHLQFTNTFTGNVVVHTRWSRVKVAFHEQLRRHVKIAILFFSSDLNLTVITGLKSRRKWSHSILISLKYLLFYLVLISPPFALTRTLGQCLPIITPACMKVREKYLVNSFASS